VNVREHNEVMVYSEDMKLLHEILAAGRGLADNLGTSLSALLMGYGVTSEVINEPGRFGADKTYVVDDPGLERFNSETHGSALLQTVKTVSPEVLLIGATKKGKELTARVVAGLGVGCMTDCTSLSLDGESRLIGKRLTYGGFSVAEVACLKRPQVATVPPGSYDELELSGIPSQVVRLNVVLSEPRVKVVEQRSKAEAGFGLKEAPIVIGCGRAFRRKEDLALLDELAGVLGAHVSCTRPLAADYHWFEEWIGLSGSKIRPRLYVSLGVSGTIQHVAGIRDAQNIVAINTDESAAIFNVADYGIVGDIFKVVPALTKQLRERLSK